MRSLFASVALLALGAGILLVLPRWWLTEFAALGAVYGASQIVRGPPSPGAARAGPVWRDLYVRAVWFESLGLLAAYFALQTNYAFGAGYSAPLKAVILALAWAGLALAGVTLAALIGARLGRSHRKSPSDGPDA